MQILKCRVKSNFLSLLSFLFPKLTKKIFVLFLWTGWILELQKRSHHFLERLLGASSAQKSQPKQQGQILHRHPKRCCHLPFWRGCTQLWKNPKDNVWLWWDSTNRKSCSDDWLFNVKKKQSTSFSFLIFSLFILFKKKWRVDSANWVFTSLSPFFHLFSFTFSSFFFYFI